MSGPCMQWLVNGGLPWEVGLWFVAIMAVAAVFGPIASCTDLLHCIPVDFLICYVAYCVPVDIHKCD